MASRLELQSKLEELFPYGKVYFQPPESLKMTVPCIRYSLSDIDLRRANNKTYTKNHRYSLTLIHKDPDNEIKDLLLDSFEYIEFDSSFVSNNLNHYVYTLYY